MRWWIVLYAFRKKMAILSVKRSVPRIVIFSTYTLSYV